MGPHGRGEGGKDEAMAIDSLPFIKDIKEDFLKYMSDPC